MGAQESCVRLVRLPLVLLPPCLLMQRECAANVGTCCGSILSRARALLSSHVVRAGMVWLQVLCGGLAEMPPLNFV